MDNTKQQKQRFPSKYQTKSKYRIRKEIYIENNGKCQRCGCELYIHGNQKDKKGKKRAHFHHKIFRCDGGKNEKENLLLTCWDCEVKFHAKHKPQKWLDQQKEKKEKQNEAN